jgi:protein-S-isoprenylcysteine O-methyltransferase Ste14
MGWALFALWELFWLIWAIFALITSPRNVRIKKFFSQLFAVIIAVLLVSVCIWFIDTSFPEYFVFFSSNTITMTIGMTITVIGFLYAIWSRAKLGRNWSGGVEILPEQKLVTDGPYKIVRHPIYSGHILALLGTALILHDLMGIMLFFGSIFVYVQKSKKEEVLLSEHFGLEYNNYKKRVKMLFPYIF